MNRLVAGAHHVCATKDDNRLWCWGRNDYGELGDGTTETQRSPTPVEVLAWPVKEFALGRNFTCAIVLPDGIQPEVHCWGQGDAGQLGQGSSSSSTTPQKVLGLPEDGELYELKAGGRPRLRRLRTRKTVLLGAKSAGRMLVANPGNLSTSQHVYADGDYTYLNQIDLGGNHGCLLHEDEQVRCWGSNGYGQVTLAPGYSSSYANPVIPDGLEDESMLGLATGAGIHAPLRPIARFIVGGTTPTALAVRGPRTICSAKPQDRWWPPPTPIGTAFTPEKITPVPPMPTIGCIVGARTVTGSWALVPTKRIVLCRRPSLGSAFFVADANPYLGPKKKPSERRALRSSTVVDPNCLSRSSPLL